MSKRTNLKAKAVIDSIPKSLTVTEDCVIYHQSPRLYPRDTSQTYQQCQSLRTVAPFTTELIEPAFVIDMQPTQTNPSTPEEKRKPYHPARDSFNDFGYLKTEDQTCGNKCYSLCCICIFGLCFKDCDFMGDFL